MVKSRRKPTSDVDCSTLSRIGIKDVGGMHTINPKAIAQPVVLEKLRKLKMKTGRIRKFLARGKTNI